MLTGLPPFYDENVNEMYKKILQAPLKFPEDMGSDAKSLLTGLLSRDPSQRLGVNGAEEIKKHPFFAKHIDWSLLLQKKIHPPFKPQVVSIVIFILCSFFFSLNIKLYSILAELSGRYIKL